MQVDVPLAVRFETTWHDILGMSPAFSLMVAGAFLVAFLIAAILTRLAPLPSGAWYMVGGMLAVALALVIIKILLGGTPIAGARGAAGLTAQAIAGLAGAWVFTRLGPAREDAPVMRVLLAALLAATCSVEAYEFEFETIVTGVNHPTALVFIGPATALLTERNGALRYVRDGRLDSQQITGVPEVYVAGQAGLFDVLPDPGFAENQRIYLAFAQGSPGSNTLKIASATLNSHELIDLQIIFTAQPLRDTAFHYGGRMIFLPDGTLLITSGDGFEYREQAQSLDNHFGKILRINSDGSVPADNPYATKAGARAEIYSYGHRNLQGLVIGGDGRVFSHEHGPRGGDELNLIEAGKNYGWPAITYGVDYSGAHVSPYSSYPGMQQPLLYWTPSIAPGGMTIYTGREFPDWQGSLLVAALAEQSVRRVVVQGRDVVAQEVLFADRGLRMRDVRVGPDGEVYLLIDAEEGQVIRVTALGNSAN